MTRLLTAAGAGFYFAHIPEGEPITAITCIVLAASALVGYWLDRRPERGPA